ncbi:PIN domain-containing protein [Vibrio crassostreae]|uniref:PIN domain-containing protein n=1 Tax=Vibrio crassostreae TaxID=246167 RepID=UPI0040687CBB
MASYTVILDACVMYPAPLRSYLMYLANTGLFRARWTEQIHDEWTRNLLKNRPELNAEQLQRTRQLMNANFPDCLIEGYESIITFNLKDFPSCELEPLGLTAIHPDEFLCDMFELDSSACVKAAQQQRASLKRPPMSQDEFLACLQKQRLPSFISHLKSFKLML